MAKFPDVNSVYTSSGTNATIPVFALKTQAKNAGWTVPKSSDGTTYNASGEQITVFGTGAGGMANTAAWGVWRDPGGRRELCWQYGGTGSGGWRVKYSANAKFSGGSPSATRVPTATDEQVIYGAGTDASPTYQGLVPTSGPARYHVLAQSTPVGGVYYLGLFVTNTGAATQLTGTFFLEAMAPGSYDASDGDPAVLQINGTTTYGATLYGWFGYGTAGATWSAAISTNVGPFNGALGVDVGALSDVNGRPWYSATIAGSVRIKGVGAYISAKGPARTYPATENTATDGYAYLGSWVYPYANNTAPSVT